MTITVLTKHDNHKIRIHFTKGIGPHYAALRCVDCNRHIQWLSAQQTDNLIQLGVEVWKYNLEGIKV